MSALDYTNLLVKALKSGAVHALAKQQRQAEALENRGYDFGQAETYTTHYSPPQQDSQEPGYRMHVERVNPAERLVVCEEPKTRRPVIADTEAKPYWKR